MLKRIVQISSIVLIAIFCIYATPFVFAEREFNNIRVTDMEDGEVTLRWDTTDNTTARVYYGENTDDYTYHIQITELKKYHEIVLKNINTDSKYYYKIVGYESSGDIYGSYTHSFLTENMIDTIKPIVTSFNVLQVVKDAVVFEWKTNEKTTSTIYYGLSLEDLDKKESAGRKKTEFFKEIDNLEPAKTYHFRVEAEDEDGNITARAFIITTKGYNFDQELKIENMRPEGEDDNMVFIESAIIEWETSLIAESTLYYGIEKDRLRKKIIASASPKLKHQAILTDLEPNTAYYYMIKVHDSFDNQKKESDERGFVTRPLTRDFVFSKYRNGDLVKVKGDSTIYRIENRTKVPYYNRSYRDHNLDDDDAHTIPQEYLDKYYTRKGYYGVYENGDVVKEKDEATTYYIDGEYKRPISNWSVFIYMGKTVRDIKIDNDRNLRDYDKGEAISHSKEIIKNGSVIKAKGYPAVYLVNDSELKPFPNAEVFENLGFVWEEIQTVPKQQLKLFYIGNFLE